MTRQGLIGIVLALSAVLTGCSTAVAGQAVPDQAKVVRIDTGNFNTEPRKVPPREPTDSERKVVAAGLLADRMVLPNEFNAEFIGTGVRVITASHQLTTLDPLDATRIGVRGMVYAFSDSRRASRQPVENGMRVVLIRMRDDGAAAGAIGDVRGANPTETLPGRPDLVVQLKPPKQSKATEITTMFAVGPLLVVATAWHEDITKSRELLPQIVDKQRERLNGFTAPSLADLATLPMDRDNIVSYTVTPDAPEPNTLTTYAGYYTRTAQLHWNVDPAANQPIYEETGMDLVGVGGNNVYRTRDAAAAKRFIELDSALTLKDKTNVQPVVIKDVPDAYCRSYGIGGVASELYYACWVAVGRYVSEFVDKQPTKTFQATAAAYRVLQRAK